MYSPLSQAFAFNNSSTNRLLRTGWLFLTIALALPAFALTARAVSPPPDGGYANNNTAEGSNALLKLTTGTDNTAIGFQALFKLTTGGANTALGSGALQQNATGSDNTALGFTALFSNTRGFDNTAIGEEALHNNTTGVLNTATGQDALFFNTTGFLNTATGVGALEFNYTGKRNTAVGASALNTGFGDDAGPGGNDNTATGVEALEFNLTGNNNTATGSGALQMNNSASNNTATGFQALYNNFFGGNNNTAEGFRALKNSRGSDNIALGSRAGINLTTGSNNIDIGAPGVAGESSTIRIGTAANQTATFIAGIRGATTGSGNAVPVVIDSAGRLGTVGSSRRFKDEIKPMDNSSEAILGLKPVTFHYKSDTQNTPQFGLIAEEVEKVNPHLVVRDDKGEIYTVRYEAVNAMLLNEFLKEHCRAEQQRKQFEEKFIQQQKQIEALTATVQKVSDQVALSKPSPQLVANP
jgi:hypothetical protein